MPIALSIDDLTTRLPRARRNTRYPVPQFGRVR
jgi:hypothetical protein